MVHASLIPRPHPLTRRNGLVNQVEFLWLAHTFVTVSPSNVQNILCQPHSKRYGYLSRGEKCYIKITNLTISLAPRNSTLFSRPCLARKCAGWPRTGPMHEWWSCEFVYRLQPRCTTPILFLYSDNLGNQQWICLAVKHKRWAFTKPLAPWMASC